MTSSEKQFIQLLRAAVSNEIIPTITDWDEIWSLAKRHHLEVMIWNVVQEDSLLPDTLKEQMTSVYNQMVTRGVKQRYCLEQIENALSKEGIPYAILKGGILQYDYPSPFSRFMSDLDFYIQPEQRPTIHKVLESIGGEFQGTESGDEQFLFWNQVGVEFHGRLLYKKTRNGIVNYPDWRFVDENKNKLSEEGYALNLIGHAVHDLAGAGPGVRYILDLWIYMNKHTPQPNWTLIDEKLKADNIYNAAHNLIDLSEFLFGNGEANPLMEEMGEYVLKGGLHGDHRRALASQGNKWNAVKKQIFRNRDEFENRYPWLKKYPFLLPITWLIRIINSFLTHRSVISNWRKEINNVSYSEIKKQKETLERFGL